MTPDDARRIVRGITYKPGYKFELGVCNNGTDYVLVIWQIGLPDARDPARTVNLRYIGPERDIMEIACYQTEDLLRWARETAAYLEVHEMHEWLRYEGKLFCDPHDRRGERIEELALGGALYDHETVDTRRWRFAPVEDPTSSSASSS